MMESFKKLFPGFRTARRLLKRQPYFRPFASLFASPPSTFEDRKPSETEDYNRSSREYYERNDMLDFWRNKPYSDPVWCGWYLWRFGQLIAGLDLRPGHRVLDFGCGTGWTSLMLAKMGIEVVGMDIAPAALELAQQSARETLPESHLSRLHFEPYSGNRISYADGTFDCVITFEAFHHLPNPMAVLREFHRVLGPNSRFGFAEPGIGHEAAEGSRTEIEEGVLEQDLDLEQLYRSGIHAGFQGMEILVPGLHPHGLTLPMKRLRWYLKGFSWLVPANMFRASILSAPIGIFWKGPYIIHTVFPRSHEARISSASATIPCTPGQSFELAADVTNKSETVWLKEGRSGKGYVRLGAHLIDSDQQIVEHDYGRAELPHDLQKNQTAKLILRLKAPEKPGHYTVRLDMVNEGVCWFAQEKSQTADVALFVR